MTSSTLQTSSKMTKPNWTKLAERANLVRRDIIKMLGIAASGHPGGSLSATDLLVVLYAEFLKHDPKNPKDPNRDRLIFSKGHGAPALYSVLAREGYFDPKGLLTLRQLDDFL